MNQSVDTSDKLDMSVIHSEHHDLIYLLLGYLSYHKNLNLSIELNDCLRNILEEIVSSHKSEDIIYDDLQGYSRLKTIIRYGAAPVNKWTNNYLICVFLANFEFIQDSNYLDLEVNCFIQSLKQECDNFFTSIEKTKYYKYGRDSNG